MSGSTFFAGTAPAADDEEWEAEGGTIKPKPKPPEAPPEPKIPL